MSDEPFDALDAAVLSLIRLFGELLLPECSTPEIDALLDELDADPITQMQTPQGDGE